jgi:transposase-like protein
MISFKGAQFPKEVILFAVFFYVRYTVKVSAPRTQVGAQWVSSGFQDGS